jgi:hypothetical protein
MIVKDPPRRRDGHKAATIPPPPVTTVGGWSLWYIPYGAEDPKLLDRFSTADAGMKVADAHNRLDWTSHDALGSDALIATGRKGSFILEPMTR